jgi:hypothetical protein
VEDADVAPAGRKDLSSETEAPMCRRDHPDLDQTRSGEPEGQEPGFSEAPNVWLGTIEVRVVPEHGEIGSPEPPGEGLVSGSQNMGRDRLRKLRIECGVLDPLERCVVRPGRWL